MLEVVVEKGRDRSLRRRHPWLLSGAVARVTGEGEQAGAWARVLSIEGEVLGHGHYSPKSALRVRMLSFGKEDAGEEDCIAAAVARAVARRASPEALVGPTDALRLVNSEADGLPGLVVDRYAGTLAVKMTTAGMARARDIVVESLRAECDTDGAYERGDGTAARREGFVPRDGELWGAVPERVAIRERERLFHVDLRHGQKTGFYLDQRGARDRVEALAEGRSVLDLFSYTGGFAVAAARGGARSVVAVDSSAEAIQAARAHVEENAPDFASRGCAHFERQDGFRFLRSTSERFGLLVIDPPPLARAQRDVARASRAYKDLVLHALRAAEPDALALVFACSYHVGPDLFRKIVFAASLDAGRPLQVLEELGAAPDHPVSIDHPEGRYLSGLLLRVA